MLVDTFLHFRFSRLKFSSGIKYFYFVLNKNKATIKIKNKKVLFSPLQISSGNTTKYEVLRNEYVLSILRTGTNSILILKFDGIYYFVLEIRSIWEGCRTNPIWTTAQISNSILISIQSFSNK